MSADPLPPELEKLIERYSAELTASTAGGWTPSILRAFAREIRLQDCEAAGKRIADVQNALIQRECGLLQETISEQAGIIAALAEALEKTLAWHDAGVCVGACSFPKDLARLALAALKANL